MPARLEMAKATVHSVLCDTTSATLIATEDADWGGEVTRSHMVRLYRTPLNRYFVHKVHSRRGGVRLLARTEAMDLFNSLPGHEMDFDEAFED